MAGPILDTQWKSAHHRFETVLKKAHEQEQLLKRSTSCSFCVGLLRLIRTPRLRRLELLLEIPTDHKNCRNHAAILPSDVTEQQARLTKPAGQRFIYVHLDFDRTTGGSSTFGSPWEPFVPNLPQPSRNVEYSRSSQCQPRLINREWIDIELLKEWHSTCINSHASVCNDREFDIDQSFPKLLLIDTKRKCLVQMERDCRYVALSYVWGSKNNFTTTVDNVLHLSQPQGLEKEHVRLPKTVKQAIELTSALGELYLWVDALCIVQDGEDKADQLNAMASLYANAILTIVAADGAHADAGLRGLHGISEPRSADQKVATLLPEQYLIKSLSKHIWDDLMLLPWSSRAWTFQEAMCSRRLLYFADNTVRWCCRQTRWSEESDADDCVAAYADVEQDQLRLTSPQLSAHKLPVLGEYEALINSYNTRKLTYDEDALNAFAGVATKLGEKFKGGLISGLPEMFFDMCLLWRPLRRMGHASRRQPKRTVGEVFLPSWSWAGWETEVTWPYTWNYTSDLAGPTPIMFGKIRPFYRVQLQYTAENGSSVPINASWFDEAMTLLDEDNLEDWTSDPADDTIIQDWGLKSGEAVVFEHDSEENIKFCFPIQLSTSVAPSRVTNLLSLRTTSGNFKLGETRRSVARIYTLDLMPAGTMWQHDENDSDFLRATTGSMEDRGTIELIAILGCLTPKEQDFIWEMPDMSVLTEFNKLDEQPKTEDIYNVMWIARDSKGTAYRKGTGIVLREVWEAEAKDWIDVTLG